MAETDKHAVVIDPGQWLRIRVGTLLALAAAFVAVGGAWWRIESTMHAHSGTLDAIRKDVDTLSQDMRAMTTWIGIKATYTTDSKPTKRP